MSTSISDTESYRAFCRRAASNDEAFDHFRTHKESGVWSVPEVWGWMYVGAMPEGLSLDGPEERAMRENDSLGGPKLCDFGRFGCVDPVTLRYLYVARDLYRRFGSLDGMRIVEIGGGYGGQARLLCKLFKVKSYTIIDLPEANRLQQRYLAGAEPEIKCTRLLFDLDRFDLAISNYAFSECRKNHQRGYIEMVFKDSPRGYITGNFEGQDTGFPRMTVGEIMAALPGSVRHPHVPNFCPGLWLLTWGEK